MHQQPTHLKHVNILITQRFMNGVNNLPVITNNIHKGSLFIRTGWLYQFSSLCKSHISLHCNKKSQRNDQMLVKQPLFIQIIADLWSSLLVAV